MNKIRLTISNFIRRHKNKIRDFGMKLLMVAMGVLIATVILYSLPSDSDKKEDEEEQKYNVYKPTETIIKGSDISEEQYEEDSNLVNKFLEYCNNSEVDKAYELLTDECKSEKYITLEQFKEYYYNYIFRKR